MYLKLMCMGCYCSLKSGLVNTNYEPAATTLNMHTCTLNNLPVHFLASCMDANSNKGEQTIASKRYYSLNILVVE